MFPLIGKARPRSWCRPPCALWLCHKCRNWKGVKRSMIEPLPQHTTKRFQVALSFAGEHRSFVGKFHSPDNSLLSFCSSPFRVEVQCQPQRGGTDRHEIHETAGY